MCFFCLLLVITTLCHSIQIPISWAIISSIIVVIATIAPYITVRSDQKVVCRESMEKVNDEIDRNKRMLDNEIKSIQDAVQPSSTDLSSSDA